MSPLSIPASQRMGVTWSGTLAAMTYTDTDTHTDTHRHTGTHTHRHRHTQTHTDKLTYKGPIPLMQCASRVLTSDVTMATTTVVTIVTTFLGIHTDDTAPRAIPPVLYTRTHARTYTHTDSRTAPLLSAA